MEPGTEEWRDLTEVFVRKHGASPDLKGEMKNSGGLLDIYHAHLREFMDDAQQWARDQGLGEQNAIFFSIERAFDSTMAHILGSICGQKDPVKMIVGHAMIHRMLEERMGISFKEAVMMHLKGEIGE